MNKNLIEKKTNHMHIVNKFLAGSEQVKCKLIRRSPTIEISKSRVPTKKL